jgi:hypothetical protein
MILAINNHRATIDEDGSKWFENPYKNMDLIRETQQKKIFEKQ